MTDLKQPKKSTTKSLSKEQIVQKVVASVDLPRPQDTPYEFKLLDNLVDIKNVIEKFNTDDPAILAVDTETTGLKWSDQIIGLSFSWSDTDNYYIPFRHDCDDQI